MSRTQLFTLLALVLATLASTQTPDSNQCTNALDCYELAVRNLQQAEKAYLDAVANIEKTLQVYTSFFNASLVNMNNAIAQIGAKQYSTTYQSIVLGANTGTGINVPPPPGASYDMTLPNLTPNNRIVATWWVLEHNILDLFKFNQITVVPASNPWQVTLLVSQPPGLTVGGLLRIGLYALYV